MDNLDRSKKTLTSLGGRSKTRDRYMDMMAKTNLMDELKTQCKRIGGTFKSSEGACSCLVGKTTVLARETNDMAIVKNINRDENEFFIKIDKPEELFHSGLGNMVISSEHASVIVDKHTGNIYSRLRR